MQWELGGGSWEYIEVVTYLPLLSGKVAQIIKFGLGGHLKRFIIHFKFTKLKTLNHNHASLSHSHGNCCRDN